MQIDQFWDFEIPLVYQINQISQLIKLKLATILGMVVQSLSRLKEVKSNIETATG